MKKRTLIILAVLGSFVLVPGCAGVMFYNQLVNAHESVSTSWAQVENVLQRRYDLIPNLVNTVKGYASHEKTVLEDVTRLRSQWGEAKTTADKVRTSQMLEDAIGRLMVVVERYPDLKANQNFLSLQDELAGTENRIAVERKRYNESILQYNVLVRRFPSNVVARLGGFQKSEAYFEAAPEAKAAPKVEF
jgi:LemA protein